MMRAFLENALKNNVETALDFYTSATEVLNWGIELWKDVPSDDKGAIFQPTFLRSIKCLRLDVLMKVNSCPAYNTRAHAHDGITRFTPRIPVNSLSRTSLQRQMISSPNLLMCHPSPT